MPRVRADARRRAAGQDRAAEVLLRAGGQGRPREDRLRGRVPPPERSELIEIK